MAGNNIFPNFSEEHFRALGPQLVDILNFTVRTSETFRISLPSVNQPFNVTPYTQLEPDFPLAGESILEFFPIFLRREDNITRIMVNLQDLQTRNRIAGVVLWNYIQQQFARLTELFGFDPLTISSPTHLWATAPRPMCPTCHRQVLDLVAICPASCIIPDNAFLNSIPDNCCPTNPLSGVNFATQYEPLQEFYPDWPRLHGEMIPMINPVHRMRPRRDFQVDAQPANAQGVCNDCGADPCGCEFLNGY